jgi:hypothetical protein
MQNSGVAVTTLHEQIAWHPLWRLIGKNNFQRCPFMDLKATERWPFFWGRKPQKRLPGQKKAAQPIRVVAAS